MKKWLRRALIAVTLIGLTMGGLYEMSTHAVRGWWYDEAMFEGRPTSYWRARIDSWVERFETPEDAEKHMRATSWEGMLSSTAIIYNLPRPTFWDKACGWVGMAAVDGGGPPKIIDISLFANVEPGSREPVLCELEGEPRHKRFVDLVRQHQRCIDQVREQREKASVW